jgi:protein-L-isoaspartate(D-aspartate) O-methyltransferase
MVEEQIRARGVCSQLVVEAMGKVAREEFCPGYWLSDAYRDGPLPIGEGQTISQPYIVAYMLEALELEGGEAVLDVGTGSGYSSALLAQIAARVHTIERNPRLACEARVRLARLGYRNVEVIEGDGTLGWPGGAPYDAIVVAAGGPEVPQALREQLVVGGRLLIPIGSGRSGQRLERLRRIAPRRYETEHLAGVRFVPLIGSSGWPEHVARAEGSF